MREISVMMSWLLPPYLVFVLCESASSNQTVRGTFKSKAPLRVQFSPALGGGGGGKGLKRKLLLGFTK